VCEFFVDKNNQTQTNIIYRKTTEGQTYRSNPSSFLIEYLGNQGMSIRSDLFVPTVTEVKSESNNTLEIIE
jgi:hypothetical protein